MGLSDARDFAERMNLEDPIAKLSAGPIHFAHAGWAFVDISAESQPSPDENFYLLYDHPYSFECDSWLSEGKRTNFPVCVMNAGYSSGWCEASFGLPLVSAEIREQGWPLRELTRSRHSLEDIFIHLMGQAHDNAPGAQA